MFVRVQHIDGSLEPALEIGEEELARHVGTLFALPGGRWVQTLKQVLREDGALAYVLVGELPERHTYSATGHDVHVRGAAEMRMGSPEFGQLMLDGSPLEDASSVDDASPVWSPDGRYLAVTSLDSWLARPRTSVLVIDADDREVVSASDVRDGFVTPQEFVGRAVWCRSSSHVDGDSTFLLWF